MKWNAWNVFKAYNISSEIMQSHKEKFKNVSVCTASVQYTCIYNLKIKIDQHFLMKPDKLD